MTQSVTTICFIHYRSTIIHYGVFYHKYVHTAVKENLQRAQFRVHVQISVKKYQYNSYWSACLQNLFQLFY
jgi:hypothetical protein